MTRTLIYRPGGLPEPGVFVSWTSLISEWAWSRSSDGVTVEIDQEFAPGFVHPPGDYWLAGVTFARHLGERDRASLGPLIWRLLGSSYTQAP